LRRAKADPALIESTEHALTVVEQQKQRRDLSASSGLLEL
jgi:hypothetical protein